MDAATIAMLVAATSLGITVIDKVWTGSWNLSGKLADMEQRLSEMISASKEEIEGRQDTHIEQVGQALTSFRDKFREIELYVRDNYVKGPDFTKALEHHNDLQKAYQDAIITRLDRVEKKLDESKCHS